MWLAVMHKGPFDSRMEKAEGFLPNTIAKEVRKECCCIPTCYDRTPFRPSLSQEPFPENTKPILSERTALKLGLKCVYDDGVSIRRHHRLVTKNPANFTAT